MNVLDEFKNYKRDFILINRNTAILLHIFTKDINYPLEEDIILSDHDNYEIDMFNTYKTSAEQFIKQFEGHNCIAFIEALRDECNKILKKDENNCSK